MGWGGGPNILGVMGGENNLGDKKIWGMKQMSAQNTNAVSCSQPAAAQRTHLTARMSPRSGANAAAASAKHLGALAARQFATLVATRLATLLAATACLSATAELRFAEPW